MPRPLLSSPLQEIRSPERQLSKIVPRNEHYRSAETMNATNGLISSRTGIVILAASALLAIVNSMLFAVATRLPVAPITRRGLIANTIAAAAAWLVLWKGRRHGVPQQVVALILFSVIHYILICNIVAVVGFGL
jgi:hypothetical protein